jgi:SAM-dependent methyltransferase
MTTNSFVRCLGHGDTPKNRQLALGYKEDVFVASKTSAAEQWRAELAGWAIPESIVATAPEPPWGFPVGLFRAEKDTTDTPSRDRAAEMLPAGGTVLDVGCGGGSGGLALVPPAGEVTGLDNGPGMLAEFAAAAASRGVTHHEVEGTWPDVADRVGVFDVVVCHHVFYNVGDLPQFVHALTEHAGRRVVVELTETHPLVVSAPLWRHFHDLDRPAGPNVDLAVAVLRECGIDVQVQRWQRPPRNVPRSDYVRLNRQRLCLPADADAEINAVMAPTDLPRDVATIWWDTLH